MWMLKVGKGRGEGGDVEGGEGGGRNYAWIVLVTSVKEDFFLLSLSLCPPRKSS